MGRGAEEESKPSVGPSLESNNNGLGFVGSSLGKGDFTLKYLGKRPKGSEGIFQINKGLNNNLSVSNSGSLFSSTRVVKAKGAIIGISGLSNVRLGGPSERTR